MPVGPATNTYIENTTSPAGDIRSFNSRSDNDPNLATPRSGSFAVNDIGTADSTFIATTMEPLRHVHAQVLTSTANGITDIRFYRVWLYKGVTGLDIEGNGTVLPVKFVSVNSECRNGNTRITWTAEENGVKKFDVERSDNRNIWKVITTINTSGNGGVEKSYSYEDNSTNTNSIYRIVAYDLNGSKIHSNVFTSSCSVISGSFKVYPNPVKVSTTVSIASAETAEIELSLYDSKGSSVRRSKSILLPGNNEIPVDMTGLDNGSYILRVTWANKEKIVKLVKFH